VGCDNIWLGHLSGLSVRPTSSWTSIAIWLGRPWDLDHRILGRSQAFAVLPTITKTVASPLELRVGNRNSSWRQASVQRFGRGRCQARPFSLALARTNRCSRLPATATCPVAVCDVRLTSTPGDRLTGQRQVKALQLEEPAMNDFRVRLVRGPWNKGKLVGQKTPLKLKEIWAIRVRLQVFGRTRELALFDLGIDSKLRACDLLKLKVRDVCQGGRVAARAIVVQQKTSRRCSSRLPR
jgi:hypothetical protein